MRRLKWLFLAGLLGLASCGGDHDTPPTIDILFSAKPSALVAGELLELQWSAREATTCEARAGWRGAKALTGTETIEVTEAGTQVFTLSCSNGAISAEKTLSISVAPNPALAAADISATGGGAATLPGIATVTVPPAALSSDARMVLRRTEEAAFTQIYNDTADLFSPTGSATSQLYIRLGSEQPTANVSVTFTLPQELKDRASPADEIRVMFKDVYQQAEESYESIELLPERVAPTATEISTALPPEAFYENAQGRFEAYLVLALTPTAQAASVSQGRQQLFGTTLPNALLASNECAGLSILAPVDALIPSGFGPRPAPKKGASAMHRGIDYATPEGTPVRAAASGIVSIKINGGGLTQGYGYYIQIKHDGNGASRYAHLTNLSATVADGAHVNAGDIIGLSGNTGTTTGPHLHFEFAPGGDLFSQDGRINPEPCIGAVTVGSISVSDNGNLADDSFAVSLSGQEVCRTEIGALNNCSIGALRPGEYVMRLQVLVAPDNVGTYLITLNTPTMTINGLSSVSGSLPQGGTIDYTLVVR